MSGWGSLAAAASSDDCGRPRRDGRVATLASQALRLADAAFGWLAKTGEHGDFNRKA
jgi:hypothetical protein